MEKITYNVHCPDCGEDFKVTVSADSTEDDVRALAYRQHKNKCVYFYE